jgi:two-component system, NarL family, sensor kinase
VTTNRLRDALALTSVTVAVCATIGSLRSGNFPGSGDSWTLGAVAIGFAALGWLVVSRQPTLPIGWLLLGGGAVQAWSFLASWWALQGLVGDPGSLPLVGPAAWLSLWMSPLPWPLVLVAPLVLFPDGRARSRRWRWFLVAVCAAVGALVVATAVVAFPVAVDRPIELVDIAGDSESTAAELALDLRALARWVAFGATIVALCGVAVAWRRSHGLERRQFTIVLIGVSVVIANGIVGAVIPAVSSQRVDGPESLGALAVLAISAAIAIAVVRYRLYNLDVLVNRTALVVLVGALLAAIYAVVLIGLALVLDDSTALSVPGVVAAGAVVIATAPVVTWATDATRGWFGRSADPTTVAERFSGQLDTEGDAHAVVERLAATVRDELRVGSVEIAIDGITPAAAGRPEGPTSSLSLDYQGRRVGEVVVAARAGERLAASDQRAIQQIGSYLAVAAEAIRVGEDLRQVQRALEEAHVEERRRVRLDLHDGVGLTLASSRLRLLALRHRLPAGLAVDDVVDQISDAIREIRRIVDGLQPSVLEDLGLLAALQILVADTREASGIEVTVGADSDLSDIPAHIATASYRVISEGLANVIRHSHGTACSIRLSRHDHRLNIAIRDNGRGFDPSTASGMGLRSIASRANATGGDASITSTTGVGTTIVVRLPA